MSGTKIGTGQGNGIPECVAKSGQFISDPATDYAKDGGDVQQAGRLLFLGRRTDGMKSLNGSKSSKARYHFSLLRCIQQVAAAMFDVFCLEEVEVHDHPVTL